MKTTITILSIFAMLSVSSGSFAKKNAVRPQSQKPAAGISSFRQNNASTGWKFGLDVMLNKSLYSDDNGAGSGAFSTGFMGVADYQIDREIGLTFKLGYDNIKFTSQPIAMYNVAVSVDYVTISGLVRYQIDNNFSAALGPIVAVAAGEGTASITRSSSTTRGLANRTTPQTVETKVVDKSGTHYGISLEASYSLQVTNQITIAPSVGYDLFLGHGSASTGDINGSWNNLHINAGMRFAF